MALQMFSSHQPFIPVIEEYERYKPIRSRGLEIHSLFYSMISHCSAEVLTNLIKALWQSKTTGTSQSSNYPHLLHHKFPLQQGVWVLVPFWNFRSIPSEANFGFEDHLVKIWPMLSFLGWEPFLLINGLSCLEFSNMVAHTFLIF